MVQTSGGKKFQDRWLGIIAWGLLAAAILLLPRLVEQQNAVPEDFTWGGIDWWTARILPMVAFVLVARAGGIDWSILPTAAFSAFVAAKMLNAGQQGVWAALLIGLGVGIVHGLLCVTLNWSSVLVTLMTGTVLLLGLGAISQGEPEMITIQDSGKPILLVLCLGGAAVAFLLNLLTPLGVPMHKRKHAGGKERGSYFMAYVVSAMLASASGLLMMSNDGGVAPTITMVQVEYIAILFFVGCSVLFDNRVMPIIMAVVCSVVVFLFSSPLGALVVSESLYLPIFLAELIFGVVFDRVYKFNYSPAFLFKVTASDEPAPAPRSFATEPKATPAPAAAPTPSEPTNDATSDTEEEKNVDEGEK